MPTISHQNFAHMNQPKKQGPQSLASGRPAKQQQVPVYTVAPPEMEQEREQAVSRAPQVSGLLPTPSGGQNPNTIDPAASGSDVDRVSTGIPGILDDGAIQAALDKKRVFEKIVLFREDHITEIEISGLKFRLRLLNANDNAYVLKQMKTIPADEQMSKLRLMILAAALVDVNGVPLEEAYNGPGEIDDLVLRKYYELNQWHSPVVNVLWAGYDKFQAGIEKEYSGSFLVK